MTGSSKSPKQPTDGIYETEDLALMRRAIDAVCAELGIEPTDAERREAVAGNVMRSWTSGGRLPLNLVAAGLEGASGRITGA